ncbi:hypothetical protein ACLX1H_005828 [Fusarium chlamydosporum]
MDRLSHRFGPSIEDVVRSIRQQSSRSAHINREVLALRSQPEGVDGLDISPCLYRYVAPVNLDFAVLTFNIHRLPFNPTPPGQDPAKWANAYLPRTMSCSKAFQEFLELADNINQLATIFASVPNAEQHWDMMYGRALHMSHEIVLSSPVSEMTPDVALTNCSFMDVVRFGMQTVVNQNLPGAMPTDIAGNPIDPEFFARVQSEFWLYEMATRSVNLEQMYNEDRLPENEEVRDLVDGFVTEPHRINILPFQRLVKWQRLAITAHKAGISDAHTMDGLFFVLQEDTIFTLGVQGLAAYLPKRGDTYELQYLFQLSSVNSQIEDFLHDFDFERQKGWYDGWFDKHFHSLNIEYLSEWEEDDPGWQEQFFWRGDDIAAAARDVGLSEPEIYFLWEMDDGSCLDAPILDDFAWLINMIEPQVYIDELR